MSTEAVPKFALVKWLNEDKGKFSIIKTSWIKNFDPKEYSIKGNDESYVVEWRGSQKKPPPGGWQCYDACIISIDDSKTVLEKHLTNLVTSEKPGVEKPGLKGPELQEKKKTVHPQLLELLGVSDADDTDQDKNYSPSPRALKRAEREDKITPTKQKPGKQRQMESVTGNEALKRKIKDQEEIILELKKENKKLKNQIVEGIPAMMTRMERVLESVTSGPSASVQAEHSAGETTPGKVEILAGTGVLVDLEAWLSAKGCSSPGAFVGRLLVNLFDKQTLLQSNFKGGSAKNAPNAAPKMKLNEAKMLALKGAMLSLFPGTKESLFGAFVNQKITNLRAAEKKNAN